ncbi:Protein of unknown function [Lentzea fradiae]|uniref:DUF3040 domain-containing protein n=1 Tax=Lentzea fradiae TaxID=200378 RepID=A0A1G7VCM9_9PSEU|nr:DUF3040 domain-containing protein [Lentzea fradiae]SDG57582.1 Protein of unknown function [Lentzea fradiae]
MLSRQEHQRLIDIERHLRATDPDLARSLSAFPDSRRARRQLAAAVVAVMVAAVLAGLGVLILS